MAPPEHLLLQWKSRDINWETFELEYLLALDRSIAPSAAEWMQKRADEAKIGNVLLVCFEKGALYCHRRLLAEEIAKRFNVEYRGEVLEDEKIE